MIIYPAIDIKDGNCVRLTQGKFSDVTVYADNPTKMALKWQSLGAQYIHLVDLDGALKGTGINRSVIESIAKTVHIPVQTGGGIRTLDDIEQLLSNGISRVILGTTAVKNPDMVATATKEYGNKIAVGIDAKDGLVAISGWEEISGLGAVDFAKQMCSNGVRHIIYTDIATDGMLQGPNISAMKEMAQSVKCDIIASGGVSSVQDILALYPTGVGGVIVGKALYTKKVDLNDAILKLKSIHAQEG